MKKAMIVYFFIWLFLLTAFFPTAKLIIDWRLERDINSGLTKLYDQFCNTTLKFESNIQNGLFLTSWVAVSNNNRVSVTGEYDTQITFNLYADNSWCGHHGTYVLDTQSGQFIPYEKVMFINDSSWMKMVFIILLYVGGSGLILLYIFFCLKKSSKD
jgi:hypothetical protein